MKIDVHAVSLVRLNGGDTLYLTTNLPEATWPFSAKPAIIQMEIARGKAEEYCEKNFPGVPLEIIYG